MARPIKEGLDYFPHDTDMSNDMKIELLESKYGLKGYAIYNKILEQTYRTGGKFSLENENVKKLFAQRWRVSEKDLTEITAFMLEIELFVDSTFNSNGVKKRIKTILNERKRQRNFYKKSTKFQQGFKPLKPRRNPVETGEIEREIESKIEIESKRESKPKTPPIDILKIVDWDTLYDTWFAYKKANKKAYKTDTGKNAFKSELIKLSGGEFETAKLIINQSVANNWAGIFELKPKTNNAKHKQSADDYNKQLINDANELLKRITN